jgi:hypothetical protein
VPRVADSHLAGGELERGKTACRGRAGHDHGPPFQDPGS